MKKKIITLSTLLWACVSFAQIPMFGIKYTTSVPSDLREKLFVQQKNSYVFGFNAQAFLGGPFEPHLVKIKSNGDTIWTKIYSNNIVQQIDYLTQVKDGGFLFGSFNSNITRTDSMGNVLWSKSFQSSIGDQSGIQSSDGNIVLASSHGLSNDTITIIKCDMNGDTLWTRSYHSNKQVGFTVLNSLLETSDKGFLITTSIRQTTTNLDVFLIKTDSSGHILWSRSYGSSGWEGELTVVCIESKDHGYVFGSYTTNGFISTNDWYSFICKTDSLGNIKWSKIYGYPGSQESPYSIQERSNGNLLIGGEVRLMETNSLGDTLWTHSLKASVFSFRESNIGGFVIQSLDYNQNLVLLNTDLKGKTNCLDTLRPRNIQSVFVTPQNETLTPCLSQPTLSSKLFTIRSGLKKTTLCTSTGIEVYPQSETDVHIAPNPNEGVFSIKVSDQISGLQIQVFDLLGRSIFHTSLPDKELSIDLTSSASGLYFYKVYSADKIVSSGKIVIR